MRNALTALLICLLTTACMKASIIPDDVSAPQSWGNVDNVKQIRHLYFAGQPDQAALEAAKANGVTTVINMRAPSEMDWDEQAAVEALGLKYINIPITGSDSFDPQAIAAIDEAVSKQQGEPVLLHCRSGNRAAGWLAIHLVKDHDLKQEDALAVARAAGITSDRIEKRVENYLLNH